MSKASVFNQVSHPATAALEPMLSRNAPRYFLSISRFFEEVLLEAREA